MSVQRTSRPEAWWLIRENGSYYGLITAYWIYRLFGRFVIRLTLYPITLYFLLVNGRARKASKTFLERVYQFPEGKQALKYGPSFRSSFLHFHAFASAILDKIAVWMGQIKLDDVEFEGHHVLDELVENKQGALMVASHLGNMEIFRALALHRRKIKVTVLVHTKHARNFNRLLSRVDPHSSLMLFQVSELGPAEAAELMDRVQAGEYVVIVGDRVPISGAGRVAHVDFLGEETAFPMGPFLLASMLKCPIILLFCTKSSRKYRLHIESFHHGGEIDRKGRDEKVRSLVQEYAKRLEFYTIRNPLQWFNFF